MKGTTVTLPIEMVEALDRAARRWQTTVSEVVRRMLAARLGMFAAGERPLPFANLGRSGQRHVARDAEAILAKEWTPDLDR